jgi:two-component system response regulator FixJ
MYRFVYLVDDDKNYRNSLRSLLETRGKMHLIPYDTGDDFLAARPEDQGVVLLDNRMPGSSGLEVLEKLREREGRWPVIILTGYGDITTAVQAMKLGAVNYLEKPHRAEALFEALDEAFHQIEDASDGARFARRAKSAIARLSERERQVLELLTAGFSNKEIGIKLDLSLRTIELYRGKMMDSLAAESLAEAVCLAVAGGLAPLHAADA